jgi:myo-inositol-1(or 4)-monophosphatase
MALRGAERGMGIKPWDIAVGGLLVREAGGRATSIEGDEESISTGTIVVSNGLLHEQMRRVLREGDGAPTKAQKQG